MKIYSKEINDERLDNIVELIKRKKELMYLEKDYINKNIKKYIEQNTKLIPIINNVTNLEKNYEIKKLVKYVREKAHDVYGMFQAKTINKRHNLLEELRKAIKENSGKKTIIKKEKILEKHAALLKTHISTCERIKNNKELYQTIFSITGKPESILDLGCGLNPLTIPFMELDNIDYIASEFNQPDVDFLNEYFTIMPGEIKGIAVKINLLEDYERLKEYNVDVCFLFKVLDSLENIRKNISYDIIKNIDANFIVVSFPLKTLSGKKEMNLKKRNWFEKICNRYNHNFESFELGDELYYVVKK